MTRRQHITLLSVVAGAGFAALLFTPLFLPDISPVTQGVLVGIAGIVCLVGIAFGVWDARRIERNRKAKEQIWIDH